MYNPKIFLVGKQKGELIPLESTGYVNEDRLQELIMNYPDLLPGDQINPDDPRRWLLVSREMGVPGDADAGNRWSLDHLFLDQDGIPTFVECKRSSDTRIRREVVAQMLDYAANGTQYWSMDKIRQAATETAQSQARSIDNEIAALLNTDIEQADIEGYWEMVEENLRNGRVRLLFVADETPKELRRLVEFLNEKLSDVEVLAVEIKQFTQDENAEHTALVPRVIGFTETAHSAKRAGTRRGRTTKEEFLKKCAPGIREFFETVLRLSEERGHVIYWGVVRFSVRKNLPDDQGLASFLYCQPPNVCSFFFEEKLGFSEERAASLRAELLGRGIFVEAGRFFLHGEVTEDNLEAFYRALDFILDTV